MDALIDDRSARLAKRLRVERDSRSWSLADLAERSGVPKATISKIERAEGMFYIDQNGRKILDFFGGFGSLAFGHNHPRLLEARKTFQEEKRQEIAIAFMSQYASALAHNIAKCSPGDLDMVFLGSSGSEAMEAAG